MKGLSVTECLGKTTGQSCSLQVAPGYFAEPSASLTLTCQADGGFRGSDGSAVKMFGRFLMFFDRDLAPTYFYLVTWLVLNDFLGR